MPRIALTVAYDGTCYEGWQRQACTHRPEPPTIQAVLESTLTGMLKQAVHVQAAGRTDSGVHADHQVCHLDVPERAERIDWVKALNRQLPADIRVVAAKRVPDAFHAQKGALRKRYSYSLWADSSAKALPRVARFVWSTPHLDTEAMCQAAAFLVGTHDFASFQNSGTPQRSTIRTVFAVDLESLSLGGMRCPRSWPVLTWHITGNGFLKQMVRNVIGMLVWCGLGKLAPDAVPGILAVADRRSLPSPSAPPCGLTLTHISYAEDSFSP